MEFNPEVYNSMAKAFVFRFRDRPSYNKFAAYAHGRGAHILLCDNQAFTVTTDAFTQEEALRMAKVAIGLSTISAVSLDFKGVEFTNERQMWSSICGDIAKNWNNPPLYN